RNQAFTLRTCLPQEKVRLPLAPSFAHLWTASMACRLGQRVKMWPQLVETARHLGFTCPYESPAIPTLTSQKRGLLGGPVPALRPLGEGSPRPLHWGRWEFRHRHARPLGDRIPAIQASSKTATGTH